jgi:solute carrier organic anion transporter family, member 4A
MQCDTDLVYIKNSTQNSANIVASVNDVNIEKNEKTNSCKYCCFSLCFLTHFVCPCCKYYSARTYVLILSLMILSSSMISSGYIAAIMTSLQRQYNLNTSKIGIILSSSDIISIFAVPLISYLGAKTNRPRLMSIFSLIYVLGCGIFILPYFLGSKYIIYSSNIPVNNTDESLMYQNYDLCMIGNSSYSNLLSTRVQNDTINECSTNNDSMWSYYVFIAGQLAMSLGVSPLFTLGLTYLCDNLEERSHALYTGIKF